MTLGRTCTAAMLSSFTLIGAYKVKNELNHAKKIITTILRDKTSSLEQFRKATDRVASILAHEVMNNMQIQEVTIETPLTSMPGAKFDRPVILVPVIRSGIPLLKTFLNQFEHARVGFVGLARDEETAQAHWYYEKIPQIKNDEYVIILEPMLATGGTALEVLRKLKSNGAQEKNIFFVSIVCAPEGIKAIKTEFPQIAIVTTAIDTHLNDKKFIVPGLGDFGDRYFGT